jgi:hypothetical protein
MKQTPYTFTSGKLVPQPEMKEPIRANYFIGNAFLETAFKRDKNLYAEHLSTLQSQSLKVSAELQEKLVEGQTYKEGIDFKKDIVLSDDAAEKLSSFWGGKFTELIAVANAEKSCGKRAINIPNFHKLLRSITPERQKEIEGHIEKLEKHEEENELAFTTIQLPIDFEEVIQGLIDSFPASKMSDRQRDAFEDLANMLWKMLGVKTKLGKR